MKELELNDERKIKKLYEEQSETLIEMLTDYYYQITNKNIRKTIYEIEKFLSNHNLKYDLETLNEWLMSCEQFAKLAQNIYNQRNLIELNKFEKLIIKAFNIESNLEQEKIDNSYNTDSLTMYLKEISKYPVLTASEEQELAKKMQTDKDAKEYFIKCNLKLVVSIAKNYQHQNVSFLDLISEGNEGLLKAVDRFDYTKGIKFSTYAKYWIDQKINRALSYLSKTIAIPVHQNEKLNKIKRAWFILSNQLYTNPTPEQIANYTKLPLKVVNELLNYLNEPVSIEMKIGEDDATLMDFIPDDNLTPEDQTIENLIPQKIQEAFAKASLSVNERKVITQRLGLDGQEPKSLDAIGKQMNITRERVRQIEAKGLQKLRNPHNMKLFTPFLDEQQKPKQENETLKEYLKKYTQEEIMLAKKELPLDEQLKIMKNIEQTDKQILKKLIAILENHSHEVVYSKNIYEYLNANQEEVKEILSFLNQDEIILLQMRFGQDLMHPAKLTKEFSKKFNTQLAPKIKRIKANIRNNCSPLPLTIYEYLKGVTKEEIDQILKLLSTEDQKLFYERFGTDFNHPRRLKNEKSKRFNEYLGKEIKRLYTEIKRYNKTTIYDFFKEYTKEEIDEMQKKLTPKEQKAIEKKLTSFPSSLTKEENAYFNNSLVPKMKKILTKIRVGHRYRQNNIYEYYFEYTKDEIDKAILKLTPSQLEVLKKKFGPDYQNLYQLNGQESYEFNHHIAPKMKSILRKIHQNVKPKSFYDYLKTYTKEEINEGLSLLSLENQKVIKQKFGEDLMNYNKLSDKGLQLEYNKILQRLKRYLQNIKLRNQIYFLKIIGYTPSQIAEILQISLKKVLILQEINLLLTIKNEPNLQRKKSNKLD